MYALGIDIGGTKTAIAIVDKQCKIIARDQLKTETDLAPEEVIKKIIFSVQQLLLKTQVKTDQLLGIGIGAPGPLDVSRGMITYPPNLPLWREVPIIKYFSEHFSVPIRLENDASAAAVAEHRLGAGKDYRHVLFVTISTGIGAGIIADGQLISGGKGNAGDIGHLVIDPSFGRCPCGQLGCFEFVCSGTAISREASKIKGRHVSTAEAFSLYEKGDDKMITYLDTVIERIGMGFVSLINTLDPDIIVVGGGVSQAGAVLFDPVRKYVLTHTLNKDAGTTPIVSAKLNQDAGVIGAAALILFN